MVLVMVLLLAKQIITLYHAVQKLFAKDQHALISRVKRWSVRYLAKINQNGFVTQLLTMQRFEFLENMGLI